MDLAKYGQNPILARMAKMRVWPISPILAHMAIYRAK